LSEKTKEELALAFSLAMFILGAVGCIMWLLREIVV